MWPVVLFKVKFLKSITTIHNTCSFNGIIQSCVQAYIKFEEKSRRSYIMRGTLLWLTVPAVNIVAGRKLKSKIVLEGVISILC